MPHVTATQADYTYKVAGGSFWYLWETPVGDLGAAKAFDDDDEQGGGCMLALRSCRICGSFSFFFSLLYSLTN